MLWCGGVLCKDVCDAGCCCGGGGWCVVCVGLWCSGCVVWVDRVVIMGLTGWIVCVVWVVMVECGVVEW